MKVNEEHKENLKKGFRKIGSGLRAVGKGTAKVARGTYGLSKKAYARYETSKPKIIYVGTKAYHGYKKYQRGVNKFQSEARRSPLSNRSMIEPGFRSGVTIFEPRGKNNLSILGTSRRKKRNPLELEI